MNISGYGVRLERLREEHIELVRQKRNSPEISSVMEFQKHITPEMQQTWFNSLNPENDFYFVIEYEKNKIGLIHASDIHWENKTANAGLFIWEQKYLGTHAPVLVSIAMLDVFFGVLSLKYFYAKVLNTNQAALDYNKKLGFELVPGQKASKFKTLLLTKDNYLQRASKIRAIADRFSTGTLKLELDKKTHSFLFEDCGLIFSGQLLGKTLELEYI